VLRVLQEGEVERLGSSRTIKVDVRVIAATNKDLEEEIAENRFREDLYFRLSVIPISVPPLRERLEDIPALVQHFVSQFTRDNNRRPARFAPGAIEALKQARWRGNIRELRNAVERLLIMSDRDAIEADDVRAVVRPEARSNPPAAAAPSPVDVLKDIPATLREFKEVSERAFLVEKLREFGWNISKTAEVIDTPRSNLYKKLEQYRISQDADGG
jgi:two-component system nitrogen regulation response regulator NtrX